MRRAPDSLTRQSKVGYLDARECTSVPADSPTDLEVGHATSGLVSTLSKIPSLFGQLIAYSSRRKAHAYGSRQPDRELQEAQRLVFLKWLNLNLEQQSADLEVYAAWADSDVASVIEQRLRLGLRLMVPDDTPEADRRLFLSDLQALFEVERGNQKTR